MLVCLLLACCLVGNVQCFLDGLYCGKKDCYSVLGVTREASKAEIGKTYRQLAKKFHPDMHKTQEAKKKAAVKFTTIATAYEVLKDEDTRRDYDYMLDHPDQTYAHYYRYYRRSYAPKVDARIVITVSVIVISIFQYFGAWSRYRSAIDQLLFIPKYRLQAMEIAKKEKLLDMNKKRSRKPKEQIKEEEETILKKIIADKMDIRGGYSKPTIFDMLAIQLILLPYTTVKYLAWYVRWVWNFNICKKEYGEEEKLYIIRKHMKCSVTQFESIPSEEVDSFLVKELWKEEKFQKWKAEKEEEAKAKLAESSRYKSYRRFMKNRGPGQMSFED